MRTLPGLAATAALAVSLLGCAQRQYPLAEAPRFPVHPAGVVGAGVRPVSYAEALATSTGQATGCRVTVVDRRPGWERQFRSPAVAPSQHEHAVGFVPYESIDPPGQLEQRVQSAVARMGVPAVSADVEMRSFRVVIDDREALAHDHDVLNRVARNSGPRIGPFKIGLGMSVSSDPVDPNSAFADDLARQGDGMFRPTLLRDGKRYLFGPPRELSLQPYQAGCTCEMDATVTLTGPHGSTKEFLVQVRRHVPPADRTATVGPQELTAAVSGALDDLENRLAGRIELDRRSRGVQ